MCCAAKVDVMPTMGLPLLARTHDTTRTSSSSSPTFCSCVVSRSIAVWQADLRPWRMACSRLRRADSGKSQSEAGSCNGTQKVIR